MKRWIAIGLVLAISGAVAGHTALAEIWEYEVVIFEGRTGIGVEPEGEISEQNFTVPKFHNHTILNRSSIVVINYALTLESSNNEKVTFRFNIDGIIRCEWAYRTSNTGLTADRTQVAGQLRCEVPDKDVQPGTHTLSLSTTGLGDDAVSEVTYTISLKLTEVTEPVDNVNEFASTLEMFTPLIVFGLIALWSEWKEEVWLYVLVFLSGFAAIIAVWEEIAAIRLVLVAVLISLLGKGIAVEMISRRETQ